MAVNLPVRRVGSCQPGCAACCQWLEIVVAPDYWQPDRKQWLELHGLTVMRSGFNTIVKVPLPCTALDDGKCSLYGSPERPMLCEYFPSVPADLKDLKEVCTYQFEEMPDGG